MNTLSDDTPDEISVAIARRVRTVTDSADTTDEEQDLPGSPFTAYAYRRNPSRQFAEQASGAVNVQNQIILSLPDVLDPYQFREGDIATLPGSARVTPGSEPLKAFVRQIRSYPTGLQMDLEYPVPEDLARG